MPTAPTAKPVTRFLGIDLGGGKGKKTALAVLEKKDGGVTVTQLHPRRNADPLYDANLLATIRELGQGAVVCVDAPLTLPPCVRCQVSPCPGLQSCADSEVAILRSLCQPKILPGGKARKPSFTPYTQRATEAYLLNRRAILPREALGQGMGPLTARACHLVRALAGDFRLHDNLIEVFPRATLEFLGFRDPYKKRVDTRIDILARLRDLSFGPGVWREECRQSDHIFDAVLCAYTGYLRWRDAWPAGFEGVVLPPEAGWIWVPPLVDEAAEATRAVVT